MDEQTRIAGSVAQALLEIDAVVFTPQQPVTFKSGIVSPVYVDNRRLIYWPEQWRVVIEGFRDLLAAQAPAYDVIAGIAAGGIPHSAALAYTLGQPSIFIRKAAKTHGAQNQIEGGDVTGQRVLLVEDMVTTGGSSLAGVNALREAGATVTDCLSITSYGFAEATDAFRAAGVTLHALAPFRVIVDVAQEMGRFAAPDRALIDAWMQDPHHWGQS